VIKYAALLRGIGPTNPNMRNDKLRGLFEALGYSNVQTVIASGNVLFESSSKNVAVMEARIEKAIPEKLGFKSAVIIRSKAELERLVKKDPFKKLRSGRQWYPIVTFLKKKPFHIFTAIDQTKTKTPDFMRELEKKYGKEITTRTWKTVGRILKKLNESD
jgi:uncharacterized protein (DUF1697 family)